MNEILANEIRKTIESIKDMKAQASGINNYLSILEGLVRTDYQKQVDEAYQRGYDKGYADKTNNIKVGKELAKDIYQRGLDNAWEALRKIVLNPDEGGISISDLVSTFGNASIQNICKNYSASAVIEKLEAYEEKQKADNDIKVGDEVKSIYNGILGTATNVNGFEVCVLWRDGSVGMWHVDELIKTNRHFDIASILKEMQSQ